jgi:hypothetical protein
MQDNNCDQFQVQVEQKGGEHGGIERGRYQGGPQGRYGHGRNHGYGRGGGRPPTCLNCAEIGHVL